MAECIVLKGGGGADLDVVAAGKPDVLAGKVIVDKDGEPLTGTMVNRGAVSQALGVNGTYTIPEGYHNGSGKVTQNIPIQGADVTGTDRAWATNISCWEGAACLGVRNTHYLNGVNWIQGNIPNFYAGNIKKGVNMGGLVGAFEGYVAGATDLYYRGNNVVGFSTDSYAVFDAGQITIKSGGAGGSRSLRANVNFTGYNYINFEGSFSGKYIMVNLGGVSAQVNVSGSGVWSINISSMQISGEVWILFYLMSGACYRIWLS